MSIVDKKLQSQWAAIGPLLTIRNERQYDAAIKRLNDLLDQVGTEERHPLYGLLDTLGTVIHAYEQLHHPLPKASGADVLRFLMEQHELTQAEVPEIGSQGIVSEILGGKRELNVRQIRALASRFHVSPAAFL